MYLVINTFYDEVGKQYITPDMSVPDHIVKNSEKIKRLFAAGCLQKQPQPIVIEKQNAPQKQARYQRKSTEE